MNCDSIELRRILLYINHLERWTGAPYVLMNCNLHISLEYEPWQYAWVSDAWLNKQHIALSANVQIRCIIVYDLFCPFLKSTKPVNWSSHQPFGTPEMKQIC